MKPTELLLCLGVLTIGCAQGPQAPPPPPPPPAAAATVVPQVVVAQAQAVPEATAAPAPTTKVATPVAQAGVSPKPAPTPRTAPPSSSPRQPSVAAATPGDATTPQPVAPPVRVRLDVPAGTLLPIEIQTTLSSATSQQGDPVLAALTEDVALNGFKLDKGAEVRGQVRTAVAAKRVKGRAQLVVVFDAVMKGGEKLSITTEAIDTLAASTEGKDKKIIAGGAVGGLIVGAVKDGKKGAAIGTIIGAAAGAGAVLVMKGDEVEIPRGARLTVAVTK